MLKNYIENLDTQIEDKLYGGFCRLNEGHQDEYIYNINHTSFKNFYAHILLEINKVHNILTGFDMSFEKLKNLLSKKDKEQEEHIYINRFFGDLMNPYHEYNRYTDKKGMELGQLTTKVARQIQQDIWDNHDVTYIDTDSIYHKEPINIPVDIPTETEKLEMSCFLLPQRYIILNRGEMKTKGYHKINPSIKDIQSNMKNELRARKLKTLLS